MMLGAIERSSIWQYTLFLLITLAVIVINALLPHDLISASDVCEFNIAFALRGNAVGMETFTRMQSV